MRSRRYHFCPYTLKDKQFVHYIEIGERTWYKLPSDTESFGGRPSARSSETQHGRQGHRHVPISDGVGVGKCTTGLYLYEPKSDGFGSPPRCRRCRANDDSITQAVPRLYRDNPAEVGGTARSWRPETHVAHARAQRSAVDTHAQACPVHLFSFLFLFFSKRIRLSALLAHEKKRECTRLT